MARPIEPTPPLEGEDAAKLFAELERGASAQEMARRVDAARAKLARVRSGEPIILPSLPKQPAR
jgi:hypothetical protein